MANSEPPQWREEVRMKFETMIRKQMGGPNLPWWCVDIKVAEVVKAVRHLKICFSDTRLFHISSFCQS